MHSGLSPAISILMFIAQRTQIKKLPLLEATFLL